ncbi:MAG: hypothetical protein ACYSYV_08510 [Planctomycetota bacterium]|jgi:hypothetical protein
MALPHDSATKGTDDQIVEKIVSPEFLRPGDLKKQSQFAPAIMGVKSFVKGDYGNKPRRRPRESKAKQSRFQTGRLLINLMCRKFALLLISHLPLYE